MRPVRRALWPFVGAVALIGALFLAVFPTRTYLSQREATNRAAERLEVLSEQNAALRERIEALDSDAEIERMARSEYLLVKPGEEAFAVLPPPPPPIDVPDDWPFTGLAEALRRG